MRSGCSTASTSCRADSRSRRASGQEPVWDGATLECINRDLQVVGGIAKNERAVASEYDVWCPTCDRLNALGEEIHVGVGGVEHGTCLRRTWASPENRGSAAQWFFTPDGRSVLMRRYNGPGWDNYEALALAPSLEIDGVEYRLWHDTVLWGDEAPAS